MLSNFSALDPDSFPGRRAGLSSPPHLTQSASGQKRDSRGTRERGANGVRRSGSGGWRDSGNGQRPTQPAVGRGESGRNRFTRPQRSLIERRKDLQELRRVAWGVGLCGSRGRAPVLTLGWPQRRARSCGARVKGREATPLGVGQPSVRLKLGGGVSADSSA